MDKTLAGPEQAREAIAKRSARAPLATVGSFTKRSEVKRRATVATLCFFYGKTKWQPLALIIT